MTVIKHTNNQNRITPFKLYALCSTLSEDKVQGPRTALQKVRDTQNTKLIMFLLKKHKDLLIRYNWGMKEVADYLQYMISISKQSGINITQQLLHGFILSLDEDLLAIYTPTRTIPNQYKEWAQKEIARILQGTNNGRIYGS